MDKMYNVLIADYSDYEEGKQNNGGCYIYYYSITPNNRIKGAYTLETWNSCDLMSDYDTLTIMPSEAEKLIKWAKNDNNVFIEWR